MQVEATKFGRIQDRLRQDHAVGNDDRRIGIMRGQTSRPEIVDALARHISESLDKMAAGMKPVIDMEVPLSNVAGALARMENRQVFGKIIINF